MSIASTLYTTIALLFVPGTALMLLFCVLSGGVDSFPFNTFYWIQVDTSSISELSYDVYRWTFWGICHPSTYDSSKQGVCTQLGPAVPISPMDNFNLNSTMLDILPSDFIDNEQTYFYLSKFSFAFVLIALIFTGISLINVIVSPIWSSFKDANVLYLFLAMIFATAGASCGTAVSVLVRNKFTNAGFDAKLDAAFFGMLWASVFILLVMFFLSCCTATYKAYKKETTPDYETKLVDYEALGQQPTAVVSTPAGAGEEYQAPAHESSGIKFFKIKRNSSTDEAN